MLNFYALFYFQGSSNPAEHLKIEHLELNIEYFPKALDLRLTTYGLRLQPSTFYLPPSTLYSLNLPAYYELEKFSGKADQLGAVAVFSAIHTDNSRLAVVLHQVGFPLV
ncbi:MAG TPA: hypothetical protein VGB46_07170, partial [Flavisolibacter sp.]